MFLYSPDYQAPPLHLHTTSDASPSSQTSSSERAHKPLHSTSPLPGQGKAAEEPHSSMVGADSQEVGVSEI